jgi:ArsR family transcriptional regulator
LKEANLVKYRKDGKVVFYSLTDDHVKAIFEKGLEHIRENNK